MARTVSRFSGSIIGTFSEPYTKKSGERSQGLTFWLLPDGNEDPPVEFSLDDREHDLWDSLGAGEVVQVRSGDPYFQGGARPCVSIQRALTARPASK